MEGVGSYTYKTIQWKIIIIATVMMLEISHKKKVTIDYQVATYWYGKTAIGHSKERFVEGFAEASKGQGYVRTLAQEGILSPGREV